MPAITVNGRPRPLSERETSIADLLCALDLQGKRIAVERNGTIVPRSRYAGTVLVDGDRLEIVGAVGGG